MEPQNVTLEQIARKLGVPDERLPYLKKIYDFYRRNPRRLFNRVRLLPAREERAAILVYVGAMHLDRATGENIKTKKE